MPWGRRGKHPDSKMHLTVLDNTWEGTGISQFVYDAFETSLGGLIAATSDVRLPNPGVCCPNLF